MWRWIVEVGDGAVLGSVFSRPSFFGLGSTCHPKRLDSGMIPNETPKRRPNASRRPHEEGVCLQSVGGRRRRRRGRRSVCYVPWREHAPFPIETSERLDGRRRRGRRWRRRLLIQRRAETTRQSNLRDLRDRTATARQRRGPNKGDRRGQNAERKRQRRLEGVGHGERGRQNRIGAA